MRRSLTYWRSAAFKQPDQTAPQAEMINAGTEILSAATNLIADSTGLSTAENGEERTKRTFLTAKLGG